MAICRSTGRLWLGSAIFLLVACNQQAPAPPANDQTDSGQIAAQQEAARQANQQCIVTALNDTIYKQQSDDALVAALFAQKLDGCATDFTQAFVELRQAARDYVPLAQQVIEHARAADPALALDGANVLCSIIRGEQCAPSFTEAWAGADDDLRQRATDARTKLDANKDALERVAAGYGVYVRDPNNSQPTPAISFDSGFVGGYLTHEALPAGAPSMATLLPIAERCLEQREPDNGLCNAAGQILGLRASHGEVVTLR